MSLVATPLALGMDRVDGRSRSDADMSSASPTAGAAVTAFSAAAPAAVAAPPAAPVPLPPGLARPAELREVALPWTLAPPRAARALHHPANPDHVLHYRPHAGMSLNMMGCVVYHDDACYRFDQKLSNALMGHVYTVEMFVRNAAGTYVHPVNPHKVVKVLYREFVDARRALDGRGVQEDPMHELAVLSYFQLNPHPNITGLLDYMEDEHRLYIVMEYLDGGELFNQIASNRPFAESDLRSWMWQALNGAHHMHCHGLGHLDLSLENLALCSLPEPDTVKLLDFGVCMPLPEEGAAIRPPHAVGKPRYMPPEMLGRRPLDPRKVDVWCLGVSMYIAAFGAYPFDDAVPAPERFRTLDDGTLWAQARRSPRAARWSAGVLAVLSLMLVNDPRARASIPTLLAHPWFAPLHAAS